MIGTRFSKVFLFLPISFCIPMAIAQTFESAHYKHEHVAGVWQRGFLNGPAPSAMLDLVRAMTIDTEGNIYTYGSARVRVITTTGRVWNLAGTGITGDKDGPAQTAMFNPGGSGYDYEGIAMDSKGALFVSDGINGKIRKIYKQPSGQWWVETFAGGGTDVLQPGQHARKETVMLGAPVSVTVDSLDNVWTEGKGCVYKITSTGDVTCYENTAGSSVMMQADKRQNVYMLTRAQNDAYYRIAPDGVITRIAGMLESEETALMNQGLTLPVDGPALQSSFFEHFVFTVSSDGTRLYGGGGDEYVVRRIKDGYTMTLFPDGWRTDPISRTNGWFLGSPMYVDANGTVYLVGHNPPYQLGLRKIVPIQ